MKKIFIVPCVMVLAFLTISLFAGMISAIFNVPYYDVTRSDPFVIISIPAAIILIVMYSILIDEYLENK